MDGPRDIKERTFIFGLNVIRLCHDLHRSPGPSRVLARQLLRSGTSVGANVEEAQAGQSKADFSCKMAIALKEARETIYWLRLIDQSKMIENPTLADLIREAGELSKILGSIVSHSKRGITS